MQRQISASVYENVSIFSTATCPAVTVESFEMLVRRLRWLTYLVTHLFTTRGPQRKKHHFAVKFSKAAKRSYTKMVGLIKENWI